MRRQYEAVVPLPDGCDSFVTDQWRQRAASLGLQLSSWPMPGVPGEPCGPLQWPEASTFSLARLAPFWAHFDACVLPVTAATLPWTRTALANLQLEAMPALMVVGNGLSANALADLVQLGVRDFILHPEALEELCVRIGLQVAAARRAPVVAECDLNGVPRSGAVVAAESTAIYPQAPIHIGSAELEVSDLTLEWVEQGVRRTLLPEDADQRFQANRTRFLRHFEREYVCTMLRHYRGNVTHASRAGGITRRSFWRLMRKFGIESATFRREAQEGMTQRWRTLPLKSGSLSS